MICRTLSTVLLLAALTGMARAADDYQLGLDSQRQEGVPVGVVTEHVWETSKVFAGTVRKYLVYAPKQYDGAQPALAVAGLWEVVGL